MNKNRKAKNTKLGQGLLKALKEALDSESAVVKSEQRITGEAQLKVAKEKIAQLKDSLVKGRNETMKAELGKAARVQVEALIRELEESVSDYESVRSRE